MSGFSPMITTASVKNAGYPRSLGAIHVIDRNMPLLSLQQIVKKITPSLFVSSMYDTFAPDSPLLTVEMYKRLTAFEFGEPKVSITIHALEFS